MKILIISSLYGVSGGGAGIITHHLSHGLSALGNQVAVITTGTGYDCSVSEEEAVSVYRFNPRNIYLFEEKDFHPAWQKVLWQILDVYNFPSGKMIQQILKRESPDIIHIHKMRGFSGAVWLVAAQMFPGRVIQTCHDYESMSPDGLLRGSIGKMALRQQWPVRGYQLLRSKLSAGVSTVTAPSVHTLKRIKDSGLFPFAHSKVVANTHGWSQDNLRSLHQKANNTSQGNIHFLFLGRLEREKGIIELCEAFLQTFKLHSTMHLTVAGWGTLDSALQEKYGKFTNISLLGAVDGKTKENVLARADVVVVPSLVEEVFGLVTIEAFAMGKPVIASNVGGIPELVRHGETGWLVEAGNVRMLAEQLMAVTRMEPFLLAKISQNCKEHSYKFSLERILMEYLDIYHQMIK